MEKNKTPCLGHYYLQSNYRICIKLLSETYLRSWDRPLNSVDDSDSYTELLHRTTSFFVFYFLLWLNSHLSLYDPSAERGPVCIIMCRVELFFSIATSPEGRK